jgi:hypothetical protein
MKLPYRVWSDDHTPDPKRDLERAGEDLIRAGLVTNPAALRPRPAHLCNPPQPAPVTPRPVSPDSP